MLVDPGIQVDHTTMFRWIQAYAPELDMRIRSHLRMTNGSWRVDETYIQVRGEWVYLYHAVDAAGQTIDFLLSRRRDAVAARRFFRKALGQPHTVNLIYKRNRFPPQIFAHAVWLYFRFPLSLRLVEGMLLEP